MDLESFEPSDESMERIEERLRELRELRMRPSFRTKFRHNFDSERSNDFALKIESLELAEPLLFSAHDGGIEERAACLTVDTAYMSTLQHERLLKDLELLGFRAWESLGKKEEFDRITQQAITWGQLEDQTTHCLYQDSEDSLCTQEALSSHWVDDLERLNRRARGLRLAQPGTRFTLSAGKDLEHLLSNDDNLHHNILSSGLMSLRPHHKRAGDFWVSRSAHEPLEYVIEVKGLHAEVAHDEDDVVVKYEGYEPDAHIQHR